MDAGRMRNLAVRLAAEYRDARSDADLSRIEQKIQAYTGDDKAAADRLRRIIRE